MRHRISFTQVSRLRDILQRDLADCIQSVLERLPMKAHMYSEPDFLIELPGLTLARLRALINVTAAGVTQIILRFRYFIGGLQSAFRVDTHLAVPTLEHRERIAVEALADIASPIFSLAMNAQRIDGVPLDNERVTSKLAEIARHANEVNFHLSLLTRYVADCSRRHLGQDADSPPTRRIA